MKSIINFILQNGFQFLIFKSPWEKNGRRDTPL